MERAQPTDSSGATTEATTALDARFDEVSAALGRGDTETANRLLDEIKEELETHRRELGLAQAEDRDSDTGELKPGWQSAEDVNREMERIRAKQQEPVVGEPAVLAASTAGGPRRHRDEHGNIAPLPPDPERDRMVAEMEHFSKLSRPRQRLYEALGAVHERRARRAPPLNRPRESSMRPRPRARRPAARRAQGTRSSQDPGSEGDPEPPPAEVAPPAEVITFPRRRRPARLTFGLLSPEERGEHDGDPDAALHHFRPDLDGPARLAEFLALPEDLQEAYDRDLEREIRASRR